MQVCRDGAWVENKGVYLTFHYRGTPVDMRPDIVSKAMSIINEFGFVSNHAHAAIEAKPPVNWNKGRASIYILRTAFGLDWSNRVTIIYAGDDNTDEDAMQVNNIFIFRILRYYLSVHRNSKKKKKVKLRFECEPTLFVNDLQLFNIFIDSVYKRKNLVTIKMVSRKMMS